ncbi:pyridoxal-phosphate dependent enzyme [Sphaerisporangium sp. TRM90804]|uniref:1-aminocyclopropane-1-carboxylate deaminase/D-cysteine desulfhydrase n=1 Tax=Sphaerisporangium sp. TRM90804 TaxID=3031113 RepID=UPI00244C4F18|nr:pyridoxal-phosphate dependent enzyme [Sphaerisporangium sp. TRM90804]MDH2424944.1 pyridoxal-phosphate dependent enzyme [Sphaerisporangium sp. TRM90804]
MDDGVRTPALLPSPLEEIHDERLGGVRLLVKRDDLLHPELPGNKWRKLERNLAEAARQGRRTLLTFGGAYSNHIRATAAAGRLFGFATIGVIRGEEHTPLNPSLAYAAARGMRLTYLDRAAYRAKRDPELLSRLRDRWGDFYLLPEGGSNVQGVLGCAELPAELVAQTAGARGPGGGAPGFDVVCCACGTGGTIAGVAGGLPPGARAIGFPVLKGGGFLAEEVERLQREAFGRVRGDWALECGFHFGGYARSTPELDAFVRDFGERHGVALDRVYVGKMMYGVFALAARGAFAPGTRVVAVITGPGDAL